MKKFKLMLVAFMAMIGVNAFAVNFVNGKLTYSTLTLATNPPYKATATVTGVNGGASSLTGEFEIPATFEQEIDGITYTVTVEEIQSLQNTLITKVTIPSTVKTIGAGAFLGCTNLASIDLSGATALTTLGNQAFATTHITSFDFSACTKLHGFPNNVFVQTGLTNTFITSITLPTSTAFTTIGTSLANLTKLATVNLTATSITKIDADAFANCGELKTLELPGTVKTIATGAFNSSSVATLTINVGSLDATGIQANVYNTPTTPNVKDVLTSLTLKGELKGTIAANAFANHDKLATLDLSGMSFGTNALIGAGAFSEATANAASVTSIKMGEIKDNGNSVYTITGGAFNFGKLATVTIGNITANQAIDAAAFGTANLESVTIGDVKSGGLAINAGAFEFAANKNATITIGEVRATAGTPVFGAGAFTLSAAAATDKTATITIGAISAKGGNFTAGTFVNAENYVSSLGVGLVGVTFAGDIVQNGLDVNLFADASEVASVTFKGAIATQGLKNMATTKGIFYGIMDGATVTFSGVLAANAIGENAFEQAANSDVLKVNYTADPSDPTVIPFMQKSFFNAATTVYPVVLKISNNELAAEIRALQDADADAFYRVGLVQVVKTLVVFQKTGTSTAYGRFNLSAAEYANGMTIDRKQDGVTFTLYYTYVEDDADSKAVTINMQPIPSLDGKYRLDPTQEPLKSGNVIIVKATGVSAAETEMKFIDFDGTQNDNAWLPSILATDIGKKTFKKSTTHITNQQIVDQTFITGPADAVNMAGVFNAAKEQKKDIYFLSNPSDGKGITATAWDIKSSGVYLANGSFYAVTSYYPKANGAAAARIVWADGSEEATAIQAIEKKVVNNGAIYNLAGQKVSASYKGVVIKDGKKYIQK